MLLYPLCITSLTWCTYQNPIEFLTPLLGIRFLLISLVTNKDTNLGKVFFCFYISFLFLFLTFSFVDLRYFGKDDFWALYEALAKQMDQIQWGARYPPLWTCNFCGDGHPTGYYEQSCHVSQEQVTYMSSYQHNRYSNRPMGTLSLESTLERLMQQSIEIRLDSRILSLEITLEKFMQQTEENFKNQATFI